MPGAFRISPVVQADALSQKGIPFADLILVYGHEQHALFACQHHPFLRPGKLKLNKGDLKATQGDTGHAQINMITEIYAHILGEDRKINAQKFETAFYSNPDMRPVERSLQGEENSSVPNPDAMMKQLESAPQLMDAFTQKFIEQYGEQIMTQLAKKMLGT